jgi:effector-binding domain-containing protein
MSRFHLAAFFTIIVALSLSLGAAMAQPTPLKPPAEEQQIAPPNPNSPAPPAQPMEAFGEQVTLPERTIIYIKGQAKWDSAFETLVDSFKSLHDYFDKQGMKTAGPAMTIYTEANDQGFQFEAALPVSETPKEPPKGDIAVGHSPAGKALRFIHRGSYDSMDTTYEAITNYLDEKNLEAQDIFIEEYSTDPVSADANNLVVNVFVPLK